MKSAASPTAPSLRRKIFFRRKENKGEQAGVDKAHDAASRRIRGTFPAPFRPAKLQRDFHKAQRRAENTPMIRGVARAREEERGAARWKETSLSHAVKTHDVSYLFASPSASPRSHRDSRRVSKSEKILATSSLRSIPSLCIVSSLGKLRYLTTCPLEIEIRDRAGA